MSAKLKCYKSWNVTKTKMSQKPKCHQSWNITKTKTFKYILAVTVVPVVTFCMTKKSYKKNIVKKKKIYYNNIFDSSVGFEREKGKVPIQWGYWRKRNFYPIHRALSPLDSCSWKSGYASINNMITATVGFCHRPWGCIEGV